VKLDYIGELLFWMEVGVLIVVGVFLYIGVVLSFLLLSTRLPQFPSRTKGGHSEIEYTLAFTLNSYIVTLDTILQRQQLLLTKIIFDYTTKNQPTINLHHYTPLYTKQPLRPACTSIYISLVRAVATASAVAATRACPLCVRVCVYAVLV